MLTSSPYRKGIVIEMGILRQLILRQTTKEGRKEKAPDVIAGAEEASDLEIYLRMLRRTSAAKPTRPVPNRDIVPASGTAVIGPLEANPVFGEVFISDARRYAVF